MEIIVTKKAPAAIGPYSQAAACGGFLFLSGQLGIDPKTGALAGGTIADEARQACENVGAILNKHQIYVRPGLHCAPAAHRFCETLERGAVRVCPSAFTRKSDIDALIEVVKKIKSN